MRLSVSVAFEPRDLWVGAYWKRYASCFDSNYPFQGKRERLDVFVCLVPCLPVRVRLSWLPAGERERLLDRIVSDPAVSFGKPCIRGTRLAVVHVLEYLDAGDSWEGMLEDFYLVDDDLRAVLLFAGRPMPGEGGGR